MAMPIVPLKAYIDTRFENQEKALVTAKSELDRRLKEMNEFRKENVEDRVLFLRSDRFEAILSEWNQWRNDHVNESNGWRSRADGRLTVIETRSITWTSILGVVFTLIQIASGVLLYFMLHH